MRSFALVILATAALLAGAPARSETFTAAANSSFTIDQDDMSGHFSRWLAADLRGLNALRGKAAVTRLGVDPKWAPGFQIMLENGSGLARLFITVENGALVFRAQSWNGQTQTAEQVFATPAVLNEQFGVDFDWDDAGNVVIVIHTQANAAGVGFERRELKMPGAPTHVVVGSSTGEFKIDPLELGRVSP